jgi:hypothetical protein
MEDEENHIERDYTFYTDYHEQLAKEFKAIKHSATQKRFYRSVDEFAGRDIIYPCVVFGARPGRYIDGKTDNIFQLYPHELWFLKGVKKGDISGEKIAEKEMQNIAKQWIARILRDCGMTEDLTVAYGERPFKYFHVGEIIPEALGPIGDDNCFGWGLTLFPGNPEKFNYDETKWL